MFSPECFEEFPDHTERDSAVVEVTDPGSARRRRRPSWARTRPGSASTTPTRAPPHQLIAIARELYGGFDGILVSVGGPPAGRRGGHHRRTVGGGVRVGVPGRGTAGPGGGGRADGRRRDRLRPLRHGPRTGPRHGHLQRPPPRPRLASPSPWPTRWAHAASASSASSRAASPRTACATWTASPPPRTPDAPPTRPRFRCGGTGHRRSSGARGRFWCRPRRRMSAG